MSITVLKKNTIRRDLDAHKAFTEMLKKYNKSKQDYVMIKVTTEFEEKNTVYHMLWEVMNSSMLDFLSVLKDLLYLDDLNNYKVLRPDEKDVSNGYKDIYIYDQENFYSVMLIYLDWYVDDGEDQPLGITVRRKSDIN